MANKPCLAIVSPFIDKEHATERCVAEQVERLTTQFGYRVILYSQRVQGLKLDGAASVIWRRIPQVPGPHLIQYLWWFGANHLWRLWDRQFCRFSYDLLFSPGVNCLDADVIAVHALFSQMRRRLGSELALRGHPVRSWPRLIHRRLYYRLIARLERSVYQRRDLSLAVVSRKSGEDVGRLCGIQNGGTVVYCGLDVSRFNPERRAMLRDEARQELAIPQEAFLALLIGNGWVNKGLISLLRAAAQVHGPALRVAVVGRDDPTPFMTLLHDPNLAGRVQFHPIRQDVEAYYAAADAYVAPSLEDTFALPAAEAMACGLPVIVSSRAGASELVTDGVDGLILRDPTDAKELGRLICRLYNDAHLRQRLGENAAQTARRYTWERNAAEMHAIFQQTIASRKKQ